MNIIDIIILLIIGCFLVFSAQKGFLSSTLKLVSFFVSWLFSLLFYPLVSKGIAASPFYNTLSFYTEGVEKLADFEQSKLLVADLPQSTLHDIMSSANVSEPFNSLISKNIENQALANQGLTTVGEYFNYTMVNVIVNIISFIILFLIFIVLFNLIINALDHSLKFPVLKHYDNLIGGAVGIFRGIFFTFIPFALVPIILSLFPVAFLTDLLNSSAFGGLFYNSNFIVGCISGVI